MIQSWMKDNAKTDDDQKENESIVKLMSALLSEFDPVMFWYALYCEHNYISHNIILYP